MQSSSIEESLASAEAAVAAGEGLAGTGFWGAVATVKGHRELVDRYADRVAAIDAAAFRRWALVTVPLHIGTTLMVMGTLGGLALVAWSYALTGWWAVLAFYSGLGILLTTTHGLGHLLVGTAVGIGFTRWFVGTMRRPQPGVKIDYASYLRATARGRAWMHASGAIATKVVPFALIGAAIYADLPMWAVWGLPVLGTVMIVTDVLWSTKSSDWKKFRREMRFAQTS